MAKVQGFDVEYTHRGSWKANLRAPGKEPVIIPVAWDTDRAREAPRLTVWFKDAKEIDTYLSAQSLFLVAVAQKKLGGTRGARSADISRIFLAEPLERTLPPDEGLICLLIRAATVGDI